jgi:hypothetical protein
MKFFRTLGPILGVAVLAFIASYAVPQTSVNGGRTFLGPVDNSGATRTAPAKVTTSSPGTCTVGDFIFRSDATAGQNLFFCTATNTFTQQLNSGSSSGGGVSVYSANGLTVTANTYYFPIGGGGSPSTTETNVDVDSPAAATITNFYAQLSVALGAGNSGVFTMRKNASSQSVTCTISGASATNCSDTTHSFAVSQGDLLTVQLVTTGTIVVTPNVMFAFQFGNITATGTVNSGTVNTPACYLAAGSAVSTCTSNPVVPNSATGAPTNPLPLTGWTALNGAIWNDFASNTIGVQIQNNTSLNWRFMTKSLGSPGSSYTIYFQYYCLSTPYINTMSCDAGLTDGNKFETMEMLTQSTSGAGANNLRIEDITNTTTDSATPFGPTVNISSYLVAGKIVEDGVHRTWSYWKNGAWVQALQVNTNTFLTPTGFVVGGLSITNTGGTGVLQGGGIANYTYTELRYAACAACGW